MEGIEKQDLFVDNKDGWVIHLRRTALAEGPRRGIRPVLIVPGYGMNSFIFSFHPHGHSLESSLAAAGLEVWSVNMRGQTPAKALSRSSRAPSLDAFVLTDISAAIDQVLARTRTGVDTLTLIGASLGGTLAYAHVVLKSDHRVGAMVSIGSPLRWTEVHPALKVAFSSPQLVGALPIKGARRMAAAAVPFISKVPKLLDLYMNTSHVDLDHLSTLVQTVEDPHPAVNRAIAEWFKSQDLYIRGQNISCGLVGVDMPLLVIAANRDGICPLSSVYSVADFWGGSDVTLLERGFEDPWYAHADLFVGETAPDHVFAPLSEWLLDRGQTGPSVEALR